MVHLAGEADRAALRWCVERMRRELLDADPSAATGPLSALDDPPLARALATTHADPAHGWTVAGLARIAGASRSVLARRFTEKVSQPPIDAVVRRRMQEAARRLAEGREPVSAIARDGPPGRQRVRGRLQVRGRLAAAQLRAGDPPAPTSGPIRLANYPPKECHDA